MNKHTPTPWGINAYGEVCQDKGEFYGLRDRVEVTGFLLTGSSGNAEAAANTAHIVRCVNSHEALVNILKITAGNIRSLGPAGALENVPRPYRIWLDEVEKALAAAGDPQ